MNLGSPIFGTTLLDFLILIIDVAILIAIILEGPWYARKKKEAEKAWRKFMRDAKKYITKKEDQ